MRYALMLSFCLAFTACAMDAGPAPDVGSSAEALSYADSCVAKAFVTTINGAFVVGKVVGDGTSVRGHWVHLGAPTAGTAATCTDEDEDHADEDHADEDHADDHGEHGRVDDDEDDHGHHGRVDDDDDDHGRSDDADDDDDECEHGSAPTRHVIIGNPTSLLCRPNGGFLAHVEGTATFDGVSGYTFALQLDDLSSHGLPNQYVMVVYDAAGALVYSDPFDQVQTGTSSVVIMGPPSAPIF